MYTKNIPKRRSTGLHLIFIELPKFTPHTLSERKMQVQWLRYLTEINENTEAVPDELLNDETVKKVLSVVEESAFSEERLAIYDKF